MGHSEKMEQEDNRPKWLLELENRKRKPRLAHEVGAGAPCMMCSTACPGLDLHFWRKICKNCKCSRDDHDVPNDEFPQFDLLFGPSGKLNRKAIVLKVNKKQAEAEITFEWAPPDTTKELAADYMKALPEDKLPIKGSAGAALRKQQLQRQLPLHDIDHKVCDELSETERKQFEKYLENLKKYVGQGKVIKAMGTRPFDRSLMTPANATDMNRFSPQHKPKVPESGHSLHLRTPNSFIHKPTIPLLLSGSKTVNSCRNRDIDSPARDQSRSATARVESIRCPSLENPSHENSVQGRYHHGLANVRSDGETLNSKPVSGTRNLAVRFAKTGKLSEPSYVSISGRSDVCPARSLSSLGPGNPDIIRSEPIGGTYNPASSNMIKNANQTILPTSSINKNRGLNYATSNTIADQELAGSASSDFKIHSSLPPGHDENLVFSDAIPGMYNPAIKSNDKQRDSDSSLENSVDYEIAQNREHENSMLADKMLNEALLPPSAIHAADIIGSTLDEKGLSFIRERLTSKYSAKEEQVNLQRPELIEPGRKEGVRSKKVDQLRRQGAFDNEAERIDVTAATRKPSGTIAEEYLHQDLQRPTLESNVPGNEPWRQIMKGICDNYLTNPGQQSGREMDQNILASDKEISDNSTINSESVNGGTSCKALRAELSNYGPGNSNVIRSEGLNNPVFPEEAIISSGIVQNPVSVDRLRGAVEELSINQSKAQKCHQCQEGVLPGDVVVTAEQADEAVWHPGCFVCSVCKELLADLVYFYYKGKLYCGRDLATLLEIPRCFACDELIFVREYTVAEGHNYHVKHFCCWDCDVPLAGQQYISENDRPLCLPCYQKTYAKTCCTCNGVIAADQQGVAVKNLNFHAIENCFCCATCKKSLLNGKMAIKENRPFCSKECITKFINERPS